MKFLWAVLLLGMPASMQMAPMYTGANASAVQPSPVRSSSSASSGGGTSITISLPSGSQVGDFCVLAATGGWAPQAVSGWTQVSLLSAQSQNGAFYYKTLVSGDITAGSVTIPFSGSFGMAAIAVDFVGSHTYVNSSASQGSGSSSTAPSLVSGLDNDYVIFVASTRSATGLPSVSVGTVLTSAGSGTNSSIIANGEVLQAGYSTSVTYSFGSSAVGYYDGWLAVN